MDGGHRFPSDLVLPAILSWQGRVEAVVTIVLSVGHCRLRERHDRDFCKSPLLEPFDSRIDDRTWQLQALELPAAKLAD